MDCWTVRRGWPTICLLVRGAYMMMAPSVAVDIAGEVIQGFPLLGTAKLRPDSASTHKIRSSNPDAHISKRRLPQ